MDKSGPAFPSRNVIESKGAFGIAKYPTGLTIRDYLFGQALRSVVYKVALLNVKSEEDRDEQIRLAVSLGWRIADEALAQRGESRG
ncbi:MAG: hypothetical protein GY944_04595 [bacterium]|nr:hypothetical protein [bacterium]